MSYQQYVVVDVNPNDNAGKGGCVCSPHKQVDCKPPYIVCFGNEMWDDQSPHVVICAACAKVFAAAVGGEVLAGGERNTIPLTAMVNPTAESQRRESPVVESPDPRKDFDDTPKL